MTHCKVCGTRIRESSGIECPVCRRPINQPVVEEAEAPKEKAKNKKG